MKTTILNMPFHEALTIIEEWVKEAAAESVKIKDAGAAKHRVRLVRDNRS